ncbi:hypothetical protein E3Q18_01310 [Wallemia mellicola]|uniref:Uncharacterized protein n=1 Tax=Wallemia mellicola TaxID=1708541 RepID=A0A4T0QRM8_9BASI|nr:hypothetical protein E3Q24_00033 [Wallemia mellicola]TIB82952.1 hypothetical protein E3Q21_03191 [Wallemia mellicola]TIB85604.1 hypothetical protein E3Q20_03183 [Wallemia mellicola]TIB86333.1 hypothetical protein E3Q19_03946 [Wallemia mellicola]TIB98329.1 hypothetical protein E3Q17_03069 [Wallemia mellicola]
MVGIEELNPCAVGSTVEWRIKENKGGPSNETTNRKMDQYKKLKENGMHFNDKLQQSQQFHNPHINAKLISWVGVDEYASNVDIYSEYSHRDSSAAAIAAKQRERSTEKANTSSKRTNISFTNAKANKSRKQ